MFRTLPHSEFWVIQDPRHIQNLVYFSIFGHTEAYSIMIVIIKFLFHYNLTYISARFKKTCFLTTMTSISMLD